MRQESELISVVEEIRDLLLVLAEPALAARDQKARQEILEVVGRGEKKLAAVILMDGTRPRKAIIEEAKIDAGALSKFIAELSEKGLATEVEGKVKTICPLPFNFGQEVKP